MVESLHTLTLQDVIWINLQVIKKVRPFDYARLEEAVFYQYAYGESRSLFSQATRLATGFPKMHPFEAGNEGTLVLAVMAFIEINGYRFAADEATIRAWFEAGAKESAEKLVSKAECPSHDLIPDVRATVASLYERFPDLIDKAGGQARKKSA